MRLQRWIWCLALVGAWGNLVHADYQPGDVFAGVGGGKIKRFNASGQLLQVIDTGSTSSEDTGMCFDSAGNMYATNWTAGTVSWLDRSGAIRRYPWGGPFSIHPETCVVDAAGNVYTGEVDGANDIRKFDAQGNLLAAYNAQIEDRGVDWMDLADDQCTMYYTSEGSRVKRFDVCSNTQLTDFATGLARPCYALRIRKNGEVLVACSSQVYLLNQGGGIRRTYPRSSFGETGSLFALNIDPDGSTFWTAGYTSGQVYRVDIETGQKVGQFNAGRIGPSVAGLAVFGELTQGIQDTDGDGLLDDWEENGFDYDQDGEVDVDLPALGASSTHKDVFVYINWLDTGGLFGHSHDPGTAAMNKVIDAFDAAPVSNPDGVDGIALHVIRGGAITETATNKELGSLPQNTDCDYDWLSGFQPLKEANFPRNLWPLYHYAVFAHDLPFMPCIDGRPGGISRNGSDFYAGASDFIVALGDWETFLGEITGINDLRAGNFMHELGHNLGLGHGGLNVDATGKVLSANHTNNKPNHLSVMNYSFSSRGLRKKTFLIYTNGQMDYSRFGRHVMPDLVETDLDEEVGLNVGNAAKDYATLHYCEDTDEEIWVEGLQQPVDWNCDDDEEDSGLSTNINKDKDASDDPVLGTLNTTNEWIGLIYKGGAIGVFGPPIELPTSTSLEESPELTFAEDRELGPYEGEVTNHPPVADAGAERTRECQGNLQAAVPLDSSASIDLDSTVGTNDDIVSFVWGESGSTIAAGEVTSATFALGSHTVLLTVTDHAGAQGTDTVEITVQDTAPPTITCPANVTIECQSGGQATVSLSPATASDTCHGTATVVNDRTPNGADASGSYPLGSTTVTFTARDGSGNPASCQTIVTVVDTTPPVITCPTVPSTQCQSAGQASVNLPLATASDTCYGAAAITNDHTPNGADASGIYPLGNTTVTYLARDGAGLMSPCSTLVRVEDTLPPTIEGMSVDPTVLWPPNHLMRDVTVGYTASDICTPVVCSMSVASNEPPNGLGDGDTSPDWIVQDDHHLQLRAERSGKGSGRAYGVTVNCEDMTGHPALPSIGTVRVLHDMSSPASGSSFRINTSVKFAGTFLDVPGKTHTATWTFDGLAAPGVLTEPTGTKVGTVTGTKAFTAAGVYAVSMNVKDNLGTTGTANAVGGMDAIVVFYDPSGGYVTGGGWLDSPPGAYKADPALSGKVSFGFVSKYFKNATNPKGETDFGFRVGNFRFNALNFDYLMISGAKAMYKGSGKVNGNAGYGFILTVIDGQAPNGGGVDKFRMKIWNKNTGAIVYDNQMGAPDNADPITPAGAGSSIVIQP